jgi:hypothetical protein
MPTGVGEKTTASGENGFGFDQGEPGPSPAEADQSSQGETLGHDGLLDFGQADFSFIVLNLDQPFLGVGLAGQYAIQFVGSRLHVLFAASAFHSGYLEV